MFEVVIGVALITLIGLCIWMVKRPSKAQRRLNDLRRARMLLMNSPNYANDPEAQSVVQQMDLQNV